MTNEPRKASEIIVSLETKIDTLIKMQNTLSLNVNILSNRLNSFMDALTNSVGASSEEMGGVPSNTPTVMAPQMPDLLAFQKQMTPVKEQQPDFRRTSRPETFTEQKAPTPPPPTITAPTVAQASNKSSEVGITDAAEKVAITQRVVNKEGKAVFLADVEVVNAQNRKTEFKGRTTGVGRWSAALPVGKYQVIIRKKDLATQQQIETLQNLIIDGNSKTLDLKMVVLQ